MKKILIVVPALTLPGGIASYYLAIKEHISDICDYFTRSTHKKGVKRFFFYIVIGFHFIGKLIKSDYKIIVLNTSLSLVSVMRDIYFLILARLFKKKVVVFIRGWKDTYFESDYWKIKKFCLKLLLHCEFIIVLSEAFKEKLLGIGVKRKIFIETTTVNENFISDLVKEAIKRKLKFSNISYTMVFLARVEVYKGIYEIISAFEILKSRLRGMNLKIIGFGTQFNNIKKLITEKKLNNITLLGYLDGEKKFWELANSDLYIFLSQSEGMPNSVLEAMVCGLPVITSPVGGIKDFFIEGKMGYYCPYNPEILANIIEKIFLDKRAKSAMSIYNHQYATHNFVSSKVAQRIKKILVEID